MLKMLSHRLIKVERENNDKYLLARENPLLYNLCMSMALTKLIWIRNKKTLDNESIDYLLSLEKSLTEIKEQLLGTISNKNPKIMN